MATLAQQKSRERYRKKMKQHKIKPTPLKRVCIFYKYKRCLPSLRNLECRNCDKYEDRIKLYMKNK